MKLRTTMAMLGLLGAAWACGESAETPDPTAFRDSGTPADGAVTSSPREAGAGLPDGQVHEFVCAPPGHLELRWQPVEGAVRYAVQGFDLDMQRVGPVHLVEEPMLRLSQHFPYSRAHISAIDATGKERVIGLPSLRSDGGMALMRARRDGHTVIERLGCVNRKRPGDGITRSSVDSRPLRLTAGSPSSLRNSARYFFEIDIIDPRPQHLLFVDADLQIATLPMPEHFLAESETHPRQAIARGVVSAPHPAMTLTAHAFYAANAAGQIVRGDREGDQPPRVVIDAPLLEGRSVRALYADDEGLWVLVSASAPHPAGLLQFADVDRDARLEREVVLPKGSESAQVLDGPGLAIASDDGFIHSLRAAGGQFDEWHTASVRISKPTSLLSTRGDAYDSRPFMLVTGGEQGNELFVLEADGSDIHASYLFEGVTDLELIGFQEREPFPVP